MADTKSSTNPASKSADNAADKNQTAGANDNNQTEAVESKESLEQAKEPVSEPEPSLEDDYELLKNMNLLRNIMIRAQYGKFPDRKIDAVLKRRMDFDESKFQGPRVVRAIISVLALFLFCTVLFIIIYLVSTGLNLPEVANTASLVISLFFLSGLGFVIFNNISVPDEKKLKILIDERMTELEVELNVKQHALNNASTDIKKK